MKIKKIRKVVRARNGAKKCGNNKNADKSGRKRKYSFFQLVKRHK